MKREVNRSREAPGAQGSSSANEDASHSAWVFDHVMRLLLAQFSDNKTIKDWFDGRKPCVICSVDVKLPFIQAAVRTTLAARGWRQRPSQQGVLRSGDDFAILGELLHQPPIERSKRFTEVRTVEKIELSIDSSQKLEVSLNGGKVTVKIPVKYNSSFSQY